MQDHSVVVVGGGSTGCSVLYHLAKAGVKDALLIEKGPQVAAGQTSRSTALIRTHYSTEVLTQMALLSYRFFKGFSSILPGRTAGYVETGLVVGADEDSADALRTNSAMHKRMGIDARLMTPVEFARSRVEPLLDATKFSLFAHEPNSGYAEPSTTAASFASAAVEMGAKVLTGVRAAGIRRAGGGYSIETSQGPVRCKEAVIATGVWSRQLFESLRVTLPLKISRHPVAIFGRPPNYQGVRPVVFDFPRAAYYKPEGNDLFFVGTMASEVDTSAVEVDPDSYAEGITFEEAASFSEDAAVAFPVMAGGGTYRRGYAGLYDNTPDQHPIIDELSEYGYPGVRCVVGLSGHGFKLAPEFGRIIAALQTTGKFPDYDVSIFRLRRFDDGRLLGGRYGVSTIA